MLRKPIFINDLGFPEEVNEGDTIFQEAYNALSVNRIELDGIIYRGWQAFTGMGYYAEAYDIATCSRIGVNISIDTNLPQDLTTLSYN